MRLSVFLPIALLAACQPPADPAFDSGDNDGTASPPDTPLRPATPKPTPATGVWSESGGVLRFAEENGEARMALACAHGVLRVTLPGVAPIESEERLSFGGGGDVEALVRSTPDGRGEVEASGPAPDPARLIALLHAGPGASYGATAIGPLVPVPAAISEAFVAGCA